jgi:hypothetical protein
MQRPWDSVIVDFFRQVTCAHTGDACEIPTVLENRPLWLLLNSCALFADLSLQGHIACCSILVCTLDCLRYAGAQDSIPDSKFYPHHLHTDGGMRWRSWLTHCAASQKVAASIPDGVIGIFRWLNPFSRTVAAGSTQTVTGMSIRNISWGGGGVKAAGA